MKSYNEPFLCEKKFIKNQVDALSGERLAFLGGGRLGDLDLMGEDPAVCRKVRRILEKRVSQNYWRNASVGKRSGNRPRYETRHQLSNHYKNLFGAVPEGYRLSA
jgi:hypothetical protein